MANIHTNTENAKLSNGLLAEMLNSVIPIDPEDTNRTSIIVKNFQNFNLEASMNLLKDEITELELFYDEDTIEPTEEQKDMIYSYLKFGWVRPADDRDEIIRNENYYLNHNVL